MAFDNSYTAVTGATYSASDYNTYTKGNFTAIWVGTTAGDIEYYTSSTAKSRLAKPSADSILKNTSSGVPTWLEIIKTPGIIHASGQVDQPTQQGPYSSTTFTDVGGVTLTLTLTTTCTIFAWVFGAQSTNAGARYPYYSICIDGVDETLDVQTDLTSVPAGFMSVRRKTGITAGSRVVKLRVKIAAGGGDDVSIRQARLFAIAVAE